VNACCPLGCPVVADGRRLSVGECARKLSGDQPLTLVTGLPPLVCESIAKASKLRVLHLPPRAQEATDLRKRGSGPHLCARLGIQTSVDEMGVTAFGRRDDLRKRVRRTGESYVRSEYVRKFGCKPPCWPDCRPLTCADVKDGSRQVKDFAPLRLRIWTSTGRTRL
jgi:hypothetical protein